MNIQELNKKQPIAISVWQVHDYANSLLNAVMGMQYNQAPPADAHDLLEGLQGADHPQQIGRLIQVLKELESEIEILSDQTYQTELAIYAWSVPEAGTVKTVYDVTYNLNLAGNPDGLTTVKPRRFASGAIINRTYDDYPVYHSKPLTPLYDS
jgi:hypothetical protein